MKPLRLIAYSLIIFTMGCSSLIAAKGEKFGQDFSGAIMESDDPIYIQQALPAYLLLLDSLVKNPEPPIISRNRHSLLSNFVKSRWNLNLHQVVREG